MAICPYCKEEISADALKCRHCHSMLYPVEAEGNSGDNQVTYILDRGFLRFFKFSVGVLAIFVVFGMFAFGYDLKDTADELVVARNTIEKTIQQMSDVNKQMSDVSREMNTAKDSQRTTQEELNEVQAYIQTSMAEMDELRAEVERMQIEARRLLDEIQVHKSKGESIVSELEMAHKELVHKKVLRGRDARVSQPVAQASNGDRDALIQRKPLGVEN